MKSKLYNRRNHNNLYSKVLFDTIPKGKYCWQNFYRLMSVGLVGPCLTTTHLPPCRFVQLLGRGCGRLRDCTLEATIPLCHYIWRETRRLIPWSWFGLMGVNASATARVISRRWNDDEISFLVEETGVPGGNHRPTWRAKFGEEGRSPGFSFSFIFGCGCVGSTFCLQTLSWEQDTHIPYPPTILVGFGPGIYANPFAHSCFSSQTRQRT